MKRLKQSADGERLEQIWLWQYQGYRRKVEAYVIAIKRYSIFIIFSVLVYFIKMYIGGATSDEAIGSALVILIFGAYYTYKDS